MRPSKLPFYARRHLSSRRSIISNRRLYSDQMADKPKPNLASGQDEQTIIPRLDALLTEAENPPHRGWELVNEGKGIKRSFQFKTFNKTWVRRCCHAPLPLALAPTPPIDLSISKAFMQAVAAKCKEKNHHPEWWNVRLLSLAPSGYEPDF